MCFVRLRYLLVLDLNELGDGSIPGITSEWGAMLAQGAAVCLESQDHAQGVMLTVRGDVMSSHPVTWPPVTDQALRTWAEPRVATERGAEAIAALLAQRETDHTVIEVSWQGTGFDFWLGEESDITLQRKTRLEVSGIRHGNDGEVRARVGQKLRQIRQYDSQYGSYPALAIVVEFGRPLAEVRTT